MSIGLVQGESLVQEISHAEVRLMAMKAQRKAIIERMNNPTKIPISILLQIRLEQIQPELEMFKGQKRVLTEQRETLIQVFRDDDPRIVEFDQQIKLIDERVNNLITHEGHEEILENFRTQEVVKLFELELEIRAQEILIEDLTNKQHEQQVRSVERAESILDVNYEIAQLERVNTTLTQIEDRILAVTTELRTPGQITLLSMAVSTINPNPTTAVMIAGIGFAVFFILPLLFMLCCRCCCRRN